MVVLAGELLREAEKLVAQRIHPMVIAEGAYAPAPTCAPHAPVVWFCCGPWAVCPSLACHALRPFLRVPRWPCAPNVPCPLIAR